MLKHIKDLNRDPMIRELIRDPSRQSRTSIDAWVRM